MKREFKETKRTNIEVGEAQGEAGLKQGEQRAAELQEIRSLIDGARAETRDEEARAFLDNLQNSYLQAGREAYQHEVKEVVEATHNELEQNKDDIATERFNVATAANEVSNMQGVTELASSEARGVQKGLESTANEYDDMVQQTDDIVTSQETQSQEILRRIESILG